MPAFKIDINFDKTNYFDIVMTVVLWDNSMEDAIKQAKERIPDAHVLSIEALP